MLCKQKNACVSAPIAFSVRKSFFEKFLGNGVTSVTSVTSIDFIDVFSKHFQALQAVRVRRARLFPSEKQKPTEKPIGG
jgi:hypothetical protein